MAGQEAEVRVRLRAEGAEETKQRLLETRAALIGVSTDQLQNAQSMRQAARDATALNNAEAYQTRIFLAQHPALNTLTRGMKDFGNVSRGVLSITTAFSTAISAFNSTSSGLSEVNAELEQAKREQAFALKTYGFDSKEFADATDKVNEFTAKQKELNAQVSTENITGWLNLGAAIGVIGSSAVTTIPKIAALIPVMASASIAIGGTTIALGPLALIAAGVALAAILIVTHWKEITEFFNNTLIPAFQAFGNFMAQHWREILIIVTGGIGALAVLLIDNWSKITQGLGSAWNAIRGGFVAFANGMVTGFDAMIQAFTKGAETLANGVISGINAIIGAYNNLASVLRLPRLPTLPTISLSAPQIPLIAAANGADFMTNGPTMMLVGEAGQEHVQVTPSGGSLKGNNGPMVINYITVQGSIRSSQELAKDVDKVMKDTLKKHGWT